ncbi:hypothetical protein [Salinilacihabitans rarus]|uniref:hypothetical protein n=1 Tax=Salinilacihabitans rarus TaxID=2961596 RepID=UPI0020C918C0|nr:hypothetical protein [Salinilacihabitans rarus]
MEQMQAESSQSPRSVGVEWIVLALVAITAGIHVYLGVTEGRPPLTLAGVGYVVGAGLYASGRFRRRLVLLAIPYTAVQIPLWIVAGTPTFTWGVVDKVVQVALIAALVWHYRSR